MKKLIIAGGTGFLGNVIINHFKDKFETIVVLSRTKRQSTPQLKYIQWDAQTLGTWKDELPNTDVLINMVGKSVDCRYNQKNKDLILSSRLDSTKILGVAMAQCPNPPKIWLNSSTATIYKHSLHQEMDETTGELGTGFSVYVAKVWEKSFFETATPKTRKVALRTAIVLGKSGGALPTILRLTKFGFGGTQGRGNQKFSWIHETDFARSIEFIIQNQIIEGPVNIVSPSPSTNKKLMRMIRKIIGISFGVSLSKTILEIGARIIRTETELILKSRNVIPTTLLEHNFSFHYPQLNRALHEILHQKNDND